MTHIAVERGRGLDGEVGAALLRHNVERREVLPEHAVGGVAPRLEDHLVDLRVGCERASLVPVQGRPRVVEQAAACELLGVLGLALLADCAQSQALGRVQPRERRARGADVHHLVLREVVRNVQVLHGGGPGAENHRLAGEVLAQELDLVSPGGLPARPLVQALEGGVLEVVLGLPPAPRRRDQVQDLLEGGERRGGAAALEDEGGVAHEERGLREEVGGQPPGLTPPLVLVLAGGGDRGTLALGEELAAPGLLERPGPVLTRDLAKRLGREAPGLEAEREGLLRPRARRSPARPLLRLARPPRHRGPPRRRRCLEDRRCC